MPLKSPTKIKYGHVAGQLRRSQMITTYGPGSLADLAEYSVIMASTDYWNEKDEMIHERNLERVLKVKGFRQPYARANGLNDLPSPDVPAIRFPVMHFCPECHRLMPYYAFGKDNTVTCPDCHKRLITSRFLVGCVNGHLEDFPYNWWVHFGDFSNCNAKEAEKHLKIYFSNESSGLDSITIECTLCHSKRTMQGSMGRNGMRGYHCRGYRPWYSLIDKDKRKDPEPCEAPVRALMRGSSNLYFSVTSSALTIPPWSGKINAEIARKQTEVDSALKMIRSFGGDVEKMLATWAENEFAETLLKPRVCTTKEIVKRILDGENEMKKAYSRQDMLEDEYRVFEIGDYSEPTDQDFHIERTEVAEELKGYLDSVVLVKRLREVLALQGFRRISPEEGMDDGSDDSMFHGYRQPNGYTPLSDPEKDWLPAIEMYGEGIFLRLREDRLKDWEKRNASQYEEMKRRLEKSYLKCPAFSPRYVLLHTLAHLLIRQLSLDCGYSSASLKERIYSSFPGSDLEMQGILIYTATSDADGSLGGLVRMGQEKQLDNVFRNMLQAASWCSSDPICIRSKAQGYGSLNYAACHACTLLPETSCEMRNCLLDRAAVVGDIEESGRGYFEDLVR